MQEVRLALFNHVFKALHDKGIKVYDQLPSGDTPYPFVHLGEVAGQVEMRTKETLSGRLQQTLNVWSLANDRGQHERLMHQTEQAVKDMIKMHGNHIIIDRITTRTLVDKSTNTALLHGLIKTNYKIY